MNHFEAWLSHVSYKHSTFNVRSLISGEDAERFYLQVEWPGTDAVTGRPRQCKGRKWFLSEHMTKSEVIQTALMAVLAIEEHEAREEFRYGGQPVFGPHYDVDRLAALCDYGATDKREQRPTYRTVDGVRCVNCGESLVEHINGQYCWEAR